MDLRPPREQRRADCRGGDGADEDGSLDVLVVRGLRPERQLPDEQGHREADPADAGHSDQVRPADGAVEVGPGELHEEEGGHQDADGLPDDQAERHALGGRVACGAGQVLRAEAHPRREEREHRYGEACGDRAPQVLEAFGQALGVAPEGQRGNREAEHDPRDRGVDAGQVHEVPGQQSEGDEHPRRRPPADQDGEERDGHQGRGQPRERESSGVEDRDDDDAQQVVHHGEGQEERAERRREPPAEEGQHRDGEGDVRGHGDRPALHRATGRRGVDERVQRGRHGHPADRSEDGHDRRRGPAQLAVDHLTLELEADHEEEDRQEPVGRPLRDGEVEVQRSGADDELAQLLVPVPGGGVCPHQRHDGTQQQQDRAGVLGAQVVGEVALTSRREP